MTTRETVINFRVNDQECETILKQQKDAQYDFRSAYIRDRLLCYDSRNPGTGSFRQQQEIVVELNRTNSNVQDLMVAYGTNPESDLEARIEDQLTNIIILLESLRDRYLA